MNQATNIEVNAEQTELSIDLFNVSGEFEDIEFTIDELTGQPEMETAARRC